MSFSVPTPKSPGDSLAHPDQFVRRHIGPTESDAQEMLKRLGFDSLDALMDAAVPRQIRLCQPLRLSEASAWSEQEALAKLKEIASANSVCRSFIGMGYYDCITPAVIQRNVLENPGWYTQYTPYQAEISQGRLEALLNFQTMVADLTALDIANASLLDEATAAAEAMAMCHRLKGAPDRNAFFVADTCHPQNIDVVRTRAAALGVELMTGNPETAAFDERIFGALVQYPDTFGVIQDLTPFTAKAKAAGALVAVAADLLALTLLKPPGECGADIAVGSAQRFGGPLGYGGPHAAFIATRDEFKRHLPGRLVGVSRDARGKTALRLALGTREQHIRREKATSNICTAQALLASMASLYAVYHGPDGLRKIAERVHLLTKALAAGLRAMDGCVEVHDERPYFDTLRVSCQGTTAREVLGCAAHRQVNLRLINERSVGISLDETVNMQHLFRLLQIFREVRDKHCELKAAGPNGFSLEACVRSNKLEFPPELVRTSRYLTHPVFNRYHSETEMLRYLKRLESRDLSLTASMIPLGSCTMKLNAAAAMFPVSWPEFARIHPFAPLDQTRGYQMLFKQLESWLAEITGFAGVSLQPNAGSQGEFAGLLAIRAYHASLDEPQRNVCLIPASAHGTNPASAVMAGLRVVSVACDSCGNIDVADLRAKTEANKANLACLMVTYPSTHGVFEAKIKEICEVIHAAGGQVYMDGANMNAQVGLTSPGHIGADVCHLNLHKTFAIPHGGGGPGVGPIGVARHLLPFLPTHSVVPRKSEIRNPKSEIGAVSAAPWGSAGILPISWMYIAMMGAGGLTEATQFAILNANYISKRLENYFPTLYRNNGLIAHECILDLRAFKSTTAEDVAKRLMDYGFHAPTLSWPVASTLMVEPTESEPKCELDRFCDAMIAIHAEMTAVETGAADAKNNVLKGAPHTADMIASEDWNRPYSREQAAFPVKSLREYKFWPAVGRVDNVFGDRNPVCSCAGMENYPA
jgi:glycine dehydrogenase